MYEFYHKTKIIFGAGAIEKLGEEARIFGSKAMITCDKGVIAAGILAKAEKALKDNSIDYIVYSDVKANPRDKDCDTVADMAKKNNIDVFIGLGGGSAMDTAKAAAMLMTNKGKCNDWDWTPLDENMAPVICVPTTAGTGSEVTFVAVITDEEKEYKMSIFDPEKLAPAVALVDPDLTLTLPPSLTASTGVDALTHAIEAYTCKLAQPITDALALYAIRLIAKNIIPAVKDGQDRVARENMMMGSLIAGIAFINSNVGAVHAISETLGGKYDTAHGVGNSIFLPYIMEYNLSADVEKFGIIAEHLGISPQGKSSEALAMEGVSFIKKLNRDAGIPSLKELGYIKPEDFPLIAERSEKNALSADNAKEIGYKGYMEVLENAYAEK